MAIVKNKTRVPSEFKYIPISEREDKKPFSVTFKRMSLEDTSSVMDGSVIIDQHGRYTMQVNSQYTAILKATVKGWDNMIDEKGKQVGITIEHGELSDESLLMLPEDIRAELAMVILAVSKSPSDWESIISGPVDEATDEDK